VPAVIGRSRLGVELPCRRDGVVSPQRARPAKPRVTHPPASDSRRGPTQQLWGLSRVDEREHAVNPGGEHPALVYLARCAKVAQRPQRRRKRARRSTQRRPHPQHAPPKVHAGKCTRGGLDWACTVIGVLLRPAAHGRSPDRPACRGHPTLGQGPSTMTVTVCVPATEVISIDAMASVDIVVWWCRLCDHHGIATTFGDRVITVSPVQCVSGWWRPRSSPPANWLCEHPRSLFHRGR